MISKQMMRTCKLITCCIVVMLILLSLLVFYNKFCWAKGKNISLISAIIESNDITYSTRNYSEETFPTVSNSDLRYRLISQENAFEDSVKLSFYAPLDSTKNMELVVSDLENLYRMKPQRRDFRKGFNTFTWNRNIINTLRLKIEELNGHGNLVGLDYNTPIIIPVIIHDSELPPEIKVNLYSFVFSASSMGNVKIKIWHPKSNSTYYEKQVQLLSSKSQFLVQWEPNKSIIKPVPDGNMYLSIAYTTETNNKTQPWYVEQYIFYHQEDIETIEPDIFSGNRYEGRILSKN